MQQRKFLYLLLSILFFSCSSASEEQLPSEDDNQSSEKDFEVVDGIKIGANYIVFEPEVTSSNLGLWTKRVVGDADYHVVANDEIDAINENYIEFTGNNLNGGSPKSPLSYTFICPKTAKYRVVMRMYQPLKNGEAWDKRNDLWIKLDGDFTSACIYPTEELKKNHKFWGRGVKKWGCIHSLEGHVNGKKRLAKVVYNLKEGETYTFTMSGRAQGCSIDYVVFYEENMSNANNYNFKIESHVDLAAELPEFLKPVSQ